MDLKNANFQEILNEFPASQIESDDILVIFKQSTGKTSGILGKDVIAATNDFSSFQWSSTAEYETNDPVLYNGQWWISQVDNNVGNIPTPGANWQPENKISAIVAKPWAAGLYESHYSLVAEERTLFRLKSSVTLPFNSQSSPSNDRQNWEILEKDIAPSTVTMTNVTVLDLDNYSSNAIEYDFGSLLKDPFFNIINGRPGTEYLVSFTQNENGLSIVPAFNILGYTPITETEGDSSLYRLTVKSDNSYVLVKIADIPQNPSPLPALIIQDVDRTGKDKSGVSDNTPLDYRCFDNNTNGVNASMPNNEDWGRNDAFTILTWVKSGETTGSDNVIISNRNATAGLLSGIHITHFAGGTINVELIFDSSPDTQWRRQSGDGENVYGDAGPFTQALVNDGNWHPIVIAFTPGAGKDGLNVWMLDTTGEIAVRSTETAVEDGDPTGMDFNSGAAWYFGNWGAAPFNEDMQHAETMMWDRTLTGEEIARVLKGDVVDVDLIHWWPVVEGDGAVIHDVIGGAHGSISGAATNGWVVDGPMNYNNRYGYNTVSGDDIPKKYNAVLTDAAGNTMTESQVGKVKYDAEIVTTSPFAFKPNPNDHPELTRLGFTSATVWTEGDATPFDQYEIQKQFFRNAAESRFLSFKFPLSHWAFNNVNADLVGTVQRLLGNETPVTVLAGSSNIEGDNNTGVDDFANPAYKDPQDNEWIANNTMSGSVNETVDRVGRFDYEVNDKGNVAGPDVSYMADMKTAGVGIQLYKYGIPSISVIKSDIIPYWDPDDPSGAGVHLYPLFLNGLNEYLDIIRSAGYIPRVYFVFGAGESNRDESAATMQAGYERIDAALQRDIFEYKGDFIMIRGHDGYFDNPAFTGDVRGGQDAFVAVDPSKRKIINTDAYATWDTDQIHHTIQGNEDKGQDIATVHLTILP